MGSPPTSSSTPTPPVVADMANNDLKLRSSSTGDSAYGCQISSSPPTLSPSNTLPSLDPNTSISTTSSNSKPSKDHHHHHSFPFLFSYTRSRSRSKSPRPPPPTEIPSPSSTTINPLKHTQTQPNPSRKSPDQYHHHSPSSSWSSSQQQQQQQRRHFSDSSVPTLNTNTTGIDTTISPTSPHVLSLSPASSSPSSPPTSPDTSRRDSWIQKKQRNNSGSLSPGGFGRHGDEWLFGGISFTQTAKGLVARRASGNKK